MLTGERAGTHLLPRLRCAARSFRLGQGQIEGEDPTETHRRLAATFDPGRAKLRARFFQGSKLLLGALVVAAIVQMLLSPDVRERSKTSDMPAPINLDLENAAMDPRTPPVQYTAGLMPIHLAVMKFGDILFSDVRAALERERQSISKLDSIEFHPQTINLASKQAPQA